jgi:hypothetical protein
MGKRLIWQILFFSLILVGGLFFSFQSRAGELGVVARVGEQAPGFAGGTDFTSLGWPTINAHGKVAFRATAQAVGPFIQGIWAGLPDFLEPIVAEGDAAPGAAVDEIFCNFNFLNPIVRPIVAENGSVAFRGQLQLASDLNCAGREGIWVVSGAGIELLALEGEQAPGVSAGLIFDSIDQEFRYGNAGILLRGTLRDTSTNEVVGRGYWVGTPENLQPLLLEGDPAPDVAGANVDRLLGGFPVLNNFAESQLFAEIDASVGQELLYVGDVTSLDLLVRRGDDVPEVDSDAFFGIPDPDGLSINDMFETSFIAPVLDPRTQSIATFTALWRAQGTARELIALEDDQVPGADAGILFSSFLEAYINGKGQVVTRARPKNDPVGVNRDGIWISLPAGEGTSLQKVTRMGDIVELDGESYEMRIGAPKTTINSEGDVAFLARPLVLSDGVLRNSIWVGNENGLDLRAIVGQPVPIGDGQELALNGFNPDVFTPGAGTEDGRPAYFSDNGQLVFLGTVGTALTILISPPNATLVAVPNVVGLPQADAEAAIVGAGLVVGAVTTQNSDTVPAGSVISQDPTGGTPVAPGSAVDLVVSLGPAPSVPGDLDGDGDVDVADKRLLQDLLNTPAQQPDDPADLNGDGRITGSDISVLVKLCTRPACTEQ